MRNLLLFLLILVAVYYLRRLMSGDDRQTPGPQAGAPPDAPLDAEQVLPCAHCGVLVPASEGLEANGHFYCSPEHMRLGPPAS